MLRTSLAVGFTVALCATAVATPRAAHLQSRYASLTKRAHVKPFTAGERLVMDRASAWQWSGVGDGGAN